MSRLPHVDLANLALQVVPERFRVRLVLGSDFKIDSLRHQNRAEKRVQHGQAVARRQGDQGGRIRDENHAFPSPSSSAVSSSRLISITGI